MTVRRHPLRKASRWLFVVSALLIALGVVPVTTSSATTSTPLVPQMLVKVPGTSTIYVVDLAGCQQVQCLRLFRSDVHAKNFIALSLPPLHSVTGFLTGDLDRLVFATKSDGYAVVGDTFPTTLYATTNGARSWHRVNVRAKRSVLGLSVTAHLIYLVTANCSTNGTQCGDFQLSRSNLAASTWTSSPIPHLPGVKIVDGNFNPNVGAFNNDVWISEISLQRSPVFVSHDEGRTFTLLKTDTLASVAGCAFTAMSSTSLWASCPTGMEVSFFHSGDGGVSWSNIPTTQFSGTGGGAFDPVSPDLAYLAYGMRGPLDRINGSGQISKVASITGCSSSSSSLDYLTFTDAKRGLVLCNSGGNWKSQRILRTSDGGVHWESIQV